MNLIPKRLSQFISGITLLVLISSCGHKNQQIEHDKYITEINQWHQQRIHSLKQEDSWLSLAGLYDIKEGTHTFGSDSSNNLIFPPKAASELGTITRHDSVFQFTINPKAEVTNGNGEPVSETVMHPINGEGSQTKLRYHSLFWYIIKRRDHYFIRLKDAQNPNFDAFNGIERFPISQKWRVKATFHRFDKPETISIPDVLGEVFQDSLYGRLDFTIEGQGYSLAPLGNPDTDDQFFIIVGDKTNGNSTYGGGRFIYCATPDENGVTYIDFNKAYDPPCVFTEFATCPLPPTQNRLPIRITAGEKMYHPLKQL
ncbi:MAG TPA: DUF1684 domain-containing protein [Balneolaceae bacterium]|nr:DUF1684 domain-containing protein [Balneolaceae bacterium]